MNPTVRWVCLLLLVGVRSLSAQQLPLDSALDQPINSAAKYTQTITEAAASVTIVTADDIRRYGYRTLEDILRRVPDFYTSYDRNYTYLGVRGFGRPTDYNDRVLLLVDGHTVNEGVFGGASLGTELVLDPDAIERVEIVQGPGSALYGTGAVFASINIVLKDGAALDGTRFTVGAGSLGTWHAAASAGGSLRHAVDFAVSGEWTNVDGGDQYYREFDSATTNHGVARHLDWDRYGAATARVAWRGFTATAVAATRTKAFPTGAFGVVFDDPRSRTLDEQRFVELRYATALAPALQLELRGYATHYGYQGAYPYTTVAYDESEDDAVGSEAQLRWDIGPRNRLLVGAEYLRHAEVRYRYWDAANLFFDYDAAYGVVSAYLQDEWQVARDLSLVLGARYDHYAAFTPTAAPRAALVYHLGPRSTLKLLYGQAFRAPNVYETSYSDPISGVKQSVDLHAEHVTTSEAVWQQRLGGSLFATVAVYHYSMHDLIDTFLDPADSLLQFRNVARVSAEGASVSLNAALAGGTTGYASYAWTDAEDAIAEARLTNSPMHVAKAGLSVPLGRRVSAGAEARYESSRRTVQGTDTDPYLWTGVHLLVGPGRSAGRSAPGAVRSRRNLPRGQQPVRCQVRPARRVRAPSGGDRAGRPHAGPAVERAMVTVPPGAPG